MSKDDIDKAVKDAEMFAEEDKKRREAIDIKNAGEQAVYQTENTIKELGDKLTEDEKKALEEKLEALKETLKGTDNDKIKADTEELQKKFYEVSTRIYQEAAKAQQEQQGAAPDQGPQGGNSHGEGTVDDANYKDVTDEDKK